MEKNSKCLHISLRASKHWYHEYYQPTVMQGFVVLSQVTILEIIGGVQLYIMFHTVNRNGSFVMIEELIPMTMRPEQSMTTNYMSLQTQPI